MLISHGQTFKLSTLQRSRILLKDVLYKSLSLEFAKTIQGSDLNHRTQIKKEKGLFVPSSSAHWKS